MINYNNNKQQISQKQRINQYQNHHTNQNTSKFQQIDFIYATQEEKNRPTLSNPLKPKTKLNVNQNERQDSDRNLPASKKEIPILFESHKKEQIKNQNLSNIQGQTSNDKSNQKLKANLNTAAQRNQDNSAIERKQQQMIHQSNSSSDYSIHSDNKYWREQFYRQESNKKKLNKKVAPLANTDILQKKRMTIENSQRERSKNGFKYLFHEEAESQLQNAGMKKEKKETNNKKVQLTGEKRIPGNSLASLPKQNKVQYKYEKGKHKQGETNQQRMKNKLGFLLDHLQESSQLVSVSYYSEKSMQTNEITRPIRIDNQNQQLQASKIQGVQQQVIFAEEPRQVLSRQRQIQQQQPKEKQRDQEVQKPIFQELRLQRQPQERDLLNQSQHAVVTPKQTIDLDKSFKSKISKITPKSKILSQSLDKSRSRIISHKTPGSKHRKNSLQELNQIIADIQKKSQQYKSAVNSARSKNKSQASHAIQHTQSVELSNNYKIKSARQIKGNKEDLSHKQQTKEQVQESAQRYSKDSNQEIQKAKSSSNFSAKIEKIQFIKTPQKSRVLEGQKLKKTIQQQNKSGLQQFQEIQQFNNNVKKSSKKSSKEHDDQPIHSQTVFSPLLKKDNLQEFSQQTQEWKDRQKTREYKPKHNKFGGYLKTLQKQDIDQSDLITQYLPKNKVQFKIDLTKRLNTETSSLPNQNKKYKVFLKRRQQALLKKAKEQSKIDPKSFIFPQSSSGASKQSSIRQGKQSFSDIRLQPLTTRNVKNQGFNKLAPIIGAKKDSLYFQTGYFPNLNVKSQRQREEAKTLYVGSKKNQPGESRKRDEMSGQKSSFFKQQTEKALAKPPTVKIQFKNLLKNNNPTISQKTLDAKQKYERLKKMLQQNQ